MELLRRRRWGQEGSSHCCCLLMEKHRDESDFLKVKERVTVARDA